MTLVRTYDAATARRGVASYLFSIVRYPGLVWNNRYMVQNFLRRDLMSRVNGSFLGVGWILLQPLFLFAVYYAVFGFILTRTQEPSAEFALYLFSGVIVFHSLTESTGQACAIIIDNGNLVKKVAFPSEVLPVHAALVSVVIYLVSAVVCYTSGLLLGVAELNAYVLALPLVVIVQFMLTLGIGLILANLNVFIRDTAQLWRLLAMAWMFLSPVFWMPADLAAKLPEWAMPLMRTCNPAFPLIMAQRLALGAVGEPFGEFWPQLGIAAAWATGLLVIGYAIFMSRKHKFADLI